MCFGQVGLQLQSAFCKRARFLTSFGTAVECMHDPAFQLRVARNGEGKVWVQLDGARVKLLALFEFIEILKGAGKIVRLYESEIGLPIFSGLACHLRLFPGRQLCLEGFGDLLRKIALDRKNVSHIAVVIVGPNVLVRVCVDQLHVHSHLVSRAAHAALENVGNTESFTNFANVWSLAAILHDRRARNHLKVANLG